MKKYKLFVIDILLITWFFIYIFIIFQIGYVIYRLGAKMCGEFQFFRSYKELIGMNYEEWEDRFKKMGKNEEDNV